MSKPQIKLTRHVANREVPRAYTQLNPESDPNAIQTLVFDDAEDQESEPETAKIETMVTPPMPTPPAKPSQPVRSFEDIKRQVMSEIAVPKVVRSTQPQKQPQRHEQTQQNSQVIRSDGSIPFWKWAGALALGGIVMLVVGRGPGAKSGGKVGGSDEAEYFV